MKSFSTQIIVLTFLLSFSAIAQHKAENPTWRNEATEEEPYVSRMGKTPPWWYHLSERESAGIAKHMAAYKFENAGQEADSSGTTTESFTGQISCTLTTKDGKVEREKCFISPIATKKCQDNGAHK